MNHDALDALNPDQREAALHPGHLLAVACPGSGKTKTVAVKAQLLLAEGATVAAVTFTKKAAYELRERIVHLAGPGIQSRLIVGTFHSVDMLMAFPDPKKARFGAAILSKMRSPFTSQWKLVDEGTRRNFLARAMKHTGVEGINLNEATRIVEDARFARTRVGLDSDHAAMVDYFEHLLKQDNLIEFLDIILRTNDALRNGSMSPLPVDNLLLDEWQDADMLQFDWARHHKATSAVTAVADDDQSIYAFRRALGKAGLDLFALEFDAHRVLLGKNYRSHAEILNAAGTLIGHNTERIAKRLVSEKGPGGHAELVTYDTSEDEADAVAERASAAYHAGSEFAVIARTNMGLDDAETAIIATGIPYERSDNMSVFKYAEVQAYGALLRTIIAPNQKDIDTVLVWAGMAENDVSAIRNMNRGATIRIGARPDFDDAGVSDEARTIYNNFAKRHGEWSRNNANNLFILLNGGVREWLLDFIKKPNRPALLDVAHSLYSTRGETLEARLKTLAIAERLQGTKKDSGPEDKLKSPGSLHPVQLLTAHGSKGLEFDEVALIKFNEGVFPMEDGSLEEERRLAYVAMTRAKKTLVVSASGDKLTSGFAAESGLFATPT